MLPQPFGEIFRTALLGPSNSANTLPSPAAFHAVGLGGTETLVTPLSVLYSTFCLHQFEFLGTHPPPDFTDRTTLVMNEEPGLADEVVMIFGEGP